MFCTSVANSVMIMKRLGDKVSSFLNHSIQTDFEEKSLLELINVVQAERVANP